MGERILQTGTSKIFMTKLFLLKLKLIGYLKEDTWVTIKTPQSYTWLTAIQVARNEELLITEDYRIIKQKKPFIKNWKWRIYELMFTN
jgi:hypothetical protein